MTKDELTAVWDGLPGNTELVWHDQTDSARWTFVDIDVEVENLVSVKTTLRGSGKEVVYWERPKDVERFERRTGWEIIGDGPVPVIVLS